MSLVNDMLRDLDKRQAAERAAQAGEQRSVESMIEPDSSVGRLHYLVLALVILVSAAGAVWFIFLSSNTAVEMQSVDIAEAALVVQNEIQSPKGLAGEYAEPSTTNNVTEALADQEIDQTDLIASTSKGADINNVERKDVRNKEASATEDKKIEVKNTEVNSTEVSNVSLNRKPANKKRIKPGSEEQITKVASETKVLHETKSDAAKGLVEQKAMSSKNKLGHVSKSDSDEPALLDSVAELSELEGEAKESAIEGNNLNVVLSPSAKDISVASQAVSLLESGKSVQAFVLMESFIANNVVHDKTLEVLANRFLLEQRFGELDELLAQATKPMTPGLRQVQARWQMSMGEFDEALVTLNASVPNIDQIPEYHALLASLYQRTGQPAKAFASYSELVQFDEMVADWWAGLGISADQLNQPRQAVFAYQQAMSLPGLNPAIYSYIRKRLSALSSVQ